MNKIKIMAFFVLAVFFATHNPPRAEFSLQGAIDYANETTMHPI